MADQNFLGGRVMNLYSGSKSITWSYMPGMIIAAILICASVSVAYAQGRSEDRDKPTLLNSNKVDDDLDGSASEYFYKFTAGPGKLTVTFEVKASGTNAGATLDLFDAKSRPLLSDVLVQGVDGGSERLVKSVQFRGKQDILMRIKGVKYGDSGGTGTYAVTLDGPVSLGQGAPPDGGGGAVAAPAGGGVAAPAAANLLSGQLDPADERVLFHILNINGPGQVTFGFSVKAADAKAGANFGVLNQKGSLVFPALEVRGGESVSKPITFDKAQTITILVQVIKNPDNSGKGTYSVQLSGPVTVVR